MLLNGQHDNSSLSKVNKRKRYHAQTTITDFMGKLNCVVCGDEEKINVNRKNESTADPAFAFVCNKCNEDPAAVLGTLHSRLDTADEKADKLQFECMRCTGGLRNSQYISMLFDTTITEENENTTKSSSERKLSGRGFMSVDGCVALDCPIQYIRHQYLSRCEGIRVAIASYTATYNNTRDCDSENIISDSTGIHDLTW